MNEHRTHLQEMTILEILRTVIRLYKENFPTFLGIVLPGIAVIVTGFVILSVTLSTIVPTLSSTAGKPTSDVNQYILSIIPVFSFIFIIYIFPSIVAAPGTIVISERFLQREITVIEAYRRVLKRIFPLLGAVLVSSTIVGLATVFGLFLCVAPGIFACIFLSVWFGLIAQVVMFEGEGGLGAVKRSRTLVKEEFKKAGIVLASITVTEIIVMLIISILSSYWATKFQLTILTVAGGILFSIASMLIEPFKFTAATLLYYDLRIRREGFDANMMAEELAAGVE